MFRITEASRDQHSIKKRDEGLRTLERIHTGEEPPGRLERVANFIKQIVPTMIHTVKDGNAAAREIKEIRAQEKAEIESQPKLFDQDKA